VPLHAREVSQPMINEI